jgi:hypothetical protein
VTRRLGPIAASFVVAGPAGARVRTRLPLSADDERVLWAVGEHLGRLAGWDLARRGSQGALEVTARAVSRRERKRALTAASSSRWAGAITRTSEDAWQLGHRNLQSEARSLRARIGRIRRRLQAPVGGRRGRLRGYGSQAERFAKQQRLQVLAHRLAEVEARLQQARVSICRGGKQLARGRHHLPQAGLTQAQWRARWAASRLFLCADGEADKPWGNETIRFHPEQHWVEVKLPVPLAHLADRPHGRYRLSVPVAFPYRGAEVAAQAATGAVRYDISFKAANNRWYLDASWRLTRVAPPKLEELRQHQTFNVDLNADHLAGWVLDPCGNPVGTPHTIPLDLDGQPASARDGRLRAAVATVIRLAAAHGCRSISVEDLDFADVRRLGRETLGRGRRGKRFRRAVAGIPTRKFRELLVGMAANAGLWVIAVDPGWTSKWGKRYWQAALSRSTRASITVTGHHAAAVVIGRRGLGLGARRRPGVTLPHQRMGMGELPARPDSGAQGCQGPGPPGGQRAAAPPRKTCPAEQTGLGDQVAQDRPVSPISANRH